VPQGIPEKRPILGYKRNVPRQQIDTDNREIFHGHEHVHDITDNNEYSGSELRSRAEGHRKAYAAAVEATTDSPDKEQLSEFARSNRPVIDKGTGYPAVSVKVTPVRKGNAPTDVNTSSDEDQK
jgi:hypothetical protein